MQTYYQRHRQIKAFQFDGTWHQLYRELPSSIMNDIISYYGESTTDEEYHVRYNNHRYISELLVDIVVWPRRSHKLRNANQYWKQNLNTTTPKVYMSVINNYAYGVDNEILHYHDYVTIRPGAHPITGLIDEYQLKFYRQADFEAHWSVKPIRKRG